MAATNAGYAIFNGLWPLHGDAEHGPATVRVPLDFTNVAQIEVNLTEDEFLSQLKYVQMIYIDNADNANPLTLTLQISQQRIKVKGNTQGYYPVLAPNQTHFIFATTQGAVIVPVYFINVPLAALQWPAV